MRLVRQISLSLAHASSSTLCWLVRELEVRAAERVVLQVGQVLLNPSSQAPRGVLHAVVSAVLFLGERFTAVNALGLVILILGVVLFNWTKYRRLKEDPPAPDGAKSHAGPARPVYTLVDHPVSVAAAAAL